VSPICQRHPATPQRIELVSSDTSRLLQPPAVASLIPWSCPTLSLGRKWSYPRDWVGQTWSLGRTISYCLCQFCDDGSEPHMTGAATGFRFRVDCASSASRLSSSSDCLYCLDCTTTGQSCMRALYCSARTEALYFMCALYYYRRPLCM
jgi:hypothetical protein